MSEKEKGSVWEKTERKLIEGTVAVASKEGFNNATTAKIAKKCQVSEGTIFAHFKTIENLFLQTYLAIDKEISLYIADISIADEDTVETIERVWNKYFDYMLKIYQKAEYYLSFRRSRIFASYEHVIQDCYIGAFMEFYGGVERKAQISRIIPFKVLWTYIINSTLEFVTLVSQGKITDSPQARKLIFEMLLHPIIERL